MEKPELILNLWYVMDELGLIYSLRARCYVGTGTDEQKLALLRQFAETDYLIAQPFPVPERFHANVLEGDTSRKFPVVPLTGLNLLGGPEILFEDVYPVLENQLPAQTTLSIGEQPLICLTPLSVGPDGEIRPDFNARRRIST